MKFWNNTAKYVDFNKKVSQESQYTPDTWRLCSREFQRLFVYDNYMKGHTEHQNMLDVRGEYQAIGYMHETDLSLWKKQLGRASFPVALIGAEVPYSPVKGELYKVPTDFIFELDKLRENGLQFQRVRTKIRVPQREVVWLKERVELHPRIKGNAELAYAQNLEPELHSTITVEAVDKHIDAWVYIGMPDYWYDQLKSSLISITEGNRTVIRANGRGSGSLFAPVRRFTSNKTGKPYYYYSIKEYDD